jgi:hypothetical protein
MKREIKANEQNPLELFRYYEEFATKAKADKKNEYRSENGDGEPPFYNFTKTTLGQELYLNTREFLSKNQDSLSPAEKGQVFGRYIKLWQEYECILHIKYTEYAEEYKNARFGKSYGPYNENAPMTAGFNLQGAILENLFKPDLIFLAINFKGADFSNAEFPYSDFVNCDLTGIKIFKTNFNQCRFKKCNLQDVDMQSARIVLSNIYGM